MPLFHDWSTATEASWPSGVNNIMLWNSKYEKVGNHEILIVLVVLIVRSNHLKMPSRVWLGTQWCHFGKRYLAFDFATPLKLWWCGGRDSNLKYFSAWCSWAQFWPYLCLDSVFLVSYTIPISVAFRNGMFRQIHTDWCCSGDSGSLVLTTCSWWRVL